MNHNVTLALKTLETKAASGRMLGAKAFSMLAKDEQSLDALGIGNLHNAQDRLNSLFEELRKVECYTRRSGGFYNQGASDAEIIQDKKAARLNSPRFNAGEGQFLQRDLEIFDPINYKTLYQDVSGWRTLFPVKQENRPGADTYRYYMTDRQTLAKPGGNRATDAPMVNTNRNFFDAPVQKLHLGYDYSIDELRAHIEGGVPLETTKIDAVFEGYDIKQHQTIWNGDADYNIIGYPQQQAAGNVAAPTRNGQVAWEDKINDGTAGFGPYSVVKDLIAFVSAANEASQNRFWNAQKPGIIGVPLAQYNLLYTTIDTANASNKSILNYALDSIPGLAMIVPVIDLAGLGTGSTDLAFGWIPDPMVSQVIETMPITWQPMIKKAQTFEFYSDMKWIGPVVRYVNGFYKMHSI